MTRFTLLFLFLTCILTPGNGQTPEAIRIQGTILTDGRLDEPQWQKATPFTEFTRIQPEDGVQPTQRTEVRLLYDDDYLYAGAFMADPEPSEIIARIFERDGLTRKDDHFILVIDSHLDGLNGFAFHTTPTGVRDDYTFSGDGEGNYDGSWNTHWDVSCSILDSGWVAEYRIPWRSLRFESGPVVTMAMVFSRIIQRKKEIVISPWISSSIYPNPRFKISKGHRVTFRDLQSKNPYYLTFYQSGQVSTQAVPPNGTNGWKTATNGLRRHHYSDHPDLDRFLSGTGMDLKFGLAKNITLDLTLNPDFSQIEIDDEQLNLTRFRLIYPEKRDFFLEKAGLFTMNIGTARVFYSRRIGLDNGRPVPIPGGLRLTGRTGDHEFGVLTVRTHETPDGMVPGSQQTVLREKYSVLGNGSFIGAMLTHRADDGKSTPVTVLGTDAEIRFNTHYRWTMRAAAQNEGTGPADRWAAESSIGSVQASGLRPFLKLTRVGDGFQPGSGITTRGGYDAVYGYLSHVSLSSAESSFRLTDWKNEGGITWNQDHRPENRFLESAFISEFRSGAIMSQWIRLEQEDIFPADEYDLGSYRIRTGSYQSWRAGITGENPNGYRVKVIGSLTGGRYFDGWYADVSGETDWYAGDHWTLGGSYQHQTIDWETGFYEANLLGLRLKWTPTVTFLSTLFLQLNTLTDRLSANLRFRYQPSEGNNLYLVLTHSGWIRRDPADPGRPALDSQVIALKYTLTTGF